MPLNDKLVEVNNKVSENFCIYKTMFSKMFLKIKIQLQFSFTVSDNKPL